MLVGVHPAFGAWFQMSQTPSVLKLHSRSPDPAVAAVGVIHVEFERLRRLGVDDIKIHIVDEMADVVAPGDRVEVEHVAGSGAVRRRGSEDCHPGVL